MLNATPPPPASVKQRITWWIIMTAPEKDKKLRIQKNMSPREVKGDFAERKIYNARHQPKAQTVTWDAFMWERVGRSIKMCYFSGALHWFFLFVRSFMYFSAFCTHHGDGFWEFFIITFFSCLQPLQKLVIDSKEGKEMWVERQGIFRVVERDTFLRGTRRKSIKISILKKKCESEAHANREPERKTQEEEKTTILEASNKTLSGWKSTTNSMELWKVFFSSLLNFFFASFFKKWMAQNMKAKGFSSVRRGREGTKKINIIIIPHQQQEEWKSFLIFPSSFLSFFLPSLSLLRVCLIFNQIERKKSYRVVVGEREVAKGEREREWERIFVFMGFPFIIKGGRGFTQSEWMGGERKIYKTFFFTELHKPPHITQYRQIFGGNFWLSFVMYSSRKNTFKLTFKNELKRILHVMRKTRQLFM